jgi:hypothetical protein
MLCSRLPNRMTVDTNTGPPLVTETHAANHYPDSQRVGKNSGMGLEINFSATLLTRDSPPLYFDHLRWAM